MLLLRRPSDGHERTCMSTDLMRDGCLAKTKLAYTTPRDMRSMGPDIMLRQRPRVRWLHASTVNRHSSPQWQHRRTGTRY